MCGLGWLCPEPRTCSGLSKSFLVSDEPKGPGLGPGTQERTKTAESAWGHRQHLILCNPPLSWDTAELGESAYKQP